MGRCHGWRPTSRRSRRWRPGTGRSSCSATTTTTRGRRRGRRTSRRWDFACSATPTSPSRVARHASRLLLAHNPKIAPLAEQAGFDLQLSGHTHAGQFFPWTFVIHLVHGPHAAGLSRRGRLWVYVSASTGTWGPPVRLGTRPELTLLRLVTANTSRRR